MASIKNSVASAAVVLAAGLAFASDSRAQETPAAVEAPAAAVEAVPAPAAPASLQNPGETPFAFLSRVAETNPAALEEQVVQLFAREPSSLATLLYILQTKPGTPLAGAVASGLSQIAANDPVALSTQVSAMNVADGANAAPLIAAARLINSENFSAAVGDGLADAATRAQAANAQVAVTAIQSAVSAPGTPAALVNAFRSGFTPTAAGAPNAGAGVAGGGGGGAAAIGGGGAGTGTGFTGSSAGTGGTSTTVVAQASSASAPSGGSSVPTTTSSGQRTVSGDVSPATP